MNDNIKEYRLTGYATLVLPVDFILAAVSEERAVRYVQGIMATKYFIDDLTYVLTDDIDCRFLRNLTKKIG